jgi:hypothetical protein
LEGEAFGENEESRGKFGCNCVSPYFKTCLRYA